MDKMRCDWANRSELEKVYHDTEWGRPVTDDALLFEKMVLEVMQAGLSWTTVINKRENMRNAFDSFNVDIVSDYGLDKVSELLENSRIIRNRRKIEAIINNAKMFKLIQSEFGSFSQYLWNFVDNQPIINHFEKDEELPTQSDLSVLISKDLKIWGFKFVGPVMMYAYLQGVGVINDHLVTCFVRTEQLIVG